ncbi:hypothetical protein GCM10011402_35150 [Paracoccus acridae]|uniref:Uncharacterized protein n=1 Tax=Paracoccus acridae TaxID=1795310 RepID=A0ABQ1VM07_9RHOB|nr:hypothetical protein GCM10011402_35150 [Paracoccus acridae]
MTAQQGILDKVVRLGPVAGQGKGVTSQGRQQGKDRVAACHLIELDEADGGFLPARVEKSDTLFLEQPITDGGCSKAVAEMPGRTG